MSNQAVSAPLDLRGGVRVTSGRPLPAHLIAERQPTVGEEARNLLASLPGISRSLVTSKAMAAFAERQTANPSAAGVQALAYLAWSCREAARKKFPEDASAEIEIAEALAKLSAGCAAALGAKAAGERLLAEVDARMTAAAVAGFNAGKQAAKKELDDDRSQPVRRTEFVSDATGKITGKIEYELKPGGK